MQQFINFLLHVHTDNDNITIIITIIIAAHTHSHTRNSKYTVTTKCNILRRTIFIVSLQKDAVGKIKKIKK